MSYIGFDYKNDILEKDQSIIGFGLFFVEKYKIHQPYPSNIVMVMIDDML